MSTASKPAGFKPRFKAGVTKTNQTEETIQDSSSQDIEATQPQDVSAASKPTGFKPRFKARNTKNNTSNDV